MQGIPNILDVDPAVRTMLLTANPWGPNHRVCLGGSIPRKMQDLSNLGIANALIAMCSMETGTWALAHAITSTSFGVVIRAVAATATVLTRS
jgi:hypothetical protein